MSGDIKADICVIGAGSGGLTVTAVAAQLGVSTVLVEGHKMGGDCLNYGCVPSKALLAAAHAANGGHKTAALKLGGALNGVDGGAAFDHVRNAIKAIEPHDSVERFEEYGAQVIMAPARFVARDTVAAGDFRIRARRFVIATGSGPMVPPIDGLADTPHLTNETLFDQSSVPEHLIIVGGGPIGIEMAQAHRQLGARVTVLEMASMMPQDDPELVEVVRRRLVAAGIEIREGAQVLRTAPHGDGVSVTCGGAGGEEEIQGSHLLIAAGRRPNIHDLDLEKAGIASTPKGIEVDQRLRTTNRKIFAIGDVTGGHQFTHVAGYHAGIVVRNALFRLPAKVDKSAYPWVTYTDPELAQVGLTEQAARDEGLTFRVLRWPFADNDRAITEGETDGFVKILVDRKRRILGAGIVGPHAGELIQTWCLAMRANLKIGKIAEMIAPYPTLGEINKRVAGEYFTEGLFGARTQKLVRFLSRFG